MSELRLYRQGTQFQADLDGAPHTVPWGEVSPFANWDGLATNAISYGQQLYRACFGGSPLEVALRGLDNETRLLVVADDDADAIAWEYLRIPDPDVPEGLLLSGRVLWARGLPITKRRPAPARPERLQIIAVPAAPVDTDWPLDTAGEWTRLQEAVAGSRCQVLLTRARPASLSGLEGARRREHAQIVCFMGHSGSQGGHSTLEFENAVGQRQAVSPVEFRDSLDGNAVFVVLNSCQSATAAYNWTRFGNVARGLAVAGIPYALGMRGTVSDQAAKTLSATLFQALLRGQSIEEAVRLARRALSRQPGQEGALLAGLPVLYTGLAESLAMPPLAEGQPIVEPDPARLRESYRVAGLAPAARLFGRGVQMAEGLAALAAPIDGRFVVLHGLGGSGKTALARALADRVDYAYGDRALAFSFERYAQLDERGRAVVDAGFVGRFLPALASFYGLDPSAYPADPDLQNAVLQARQYGRGLLLLDNIETLLHAAESDVADARAMAAFVRRLRSGPGAVLLTSRTVPPADWGPRAVIEVPGLSEASGAALFRSLVSPARLGRAAPEDLRRLSARVGGHPLSIRLLAGQFEYHAAGTLADFLADIEQELVRAEQETPDSLEDAGRQRTVYACLAYSVNRLPDDLRTALGRLVVFRGAFLGEFGAFVLAGEGDVPLRALARLGLLEESALTTEDGSSVRYRLHPVARWYVERFLPPPDDDTRERYRQAYDGLARMAAAEFGYSRSPLVRQTVRDGWEDLAAAASPSLAAGRTALPYHLANLYGHAGRIRDAAALLEECLAVDQQQGDVRRVSVIQHALAGLYVQMGRLPEALALYQRSLRAEEELGDPRGVAATQNALADLYVRLGRLPEALALYQRSLRAKEELGDSREVAVTQHALAGLYVQMGRLPEALDLYQRSLRAKEELGDPRGVAVTQHALAGLYVQMGRLPEALDLYQRSLRAKEELGDPRGVAVTQNALAGLYVQMGRLPEALDLYQRALRALEELGDPRGVAATQHALAGLYVRLGRRPEALDLYERSLHTDEELGDPRGVAATQHALAGLYVRMGRLPEALDLYERSLHTDEELGDPRGVAATQHALAGLYVRMGRLPEALALYQRALRAQEELGDPRGVAVTQHALADLYVDLGRLPEALDLYQRSLRAKEELGDPREVAVTQHALAGLYVRLGRLPEALDLYERSLRAKEELGDPREVAVTQHALAGRYVRLGRLPEALDLYERSLRAAEELGDPQGVAVTQNALADLYVQMGRLPEALDLYQRSLRAKEELGDPRGVAATQHALAGLYVQMGRLPEALELYQCSLRAAEELGDPREVAVTQNALADLYVRLGRLPEALALYQRALRAKEELGDSREVAVTQHALAGLYVQMGRLPEALDLYQRSLRAKEELGDPRGVAATQNALAGLYVQMGRLPEALALYQRSLRALEELEDSREVAVTQSGLGQLLISQGQPERGLPMLWSAFQTIQSLGMPHELEQLQDILRSARSFLGADSFGRLWRQAIADPLPDWLTAPAPTAWRLPDDVDPDVAAALVAFVNTSSWAEARRLVEADPARFLRPELVAALERSISAARAAGEERLVASLQAHLERLHICIEQGIEAAFADVGPAPEGEPAQEDDGVLGQLVQRSITALAGDAQDRRAHARWLDELVAGGADPGLGALVEAVQSALFGADLDELGQDLQGDYRAAWRTIVQIVQSGVSLEGLQELLGHTLAVLRGQPERGDEWRATLSDYAQRAQGASRQPLGAFLLTLAQLIEAGGEPAGLGAGLTGIFAQAWAALLAALAEGDA